jgi:hypothetical protein
MAVPTTELLSRFISPPIARPNRALPVALGSGSSWIVAELFRIEADTCTSFLNVGALCHRALIVC